MFDDLNEIGKSDLPRRIIGLIISIILHFALVIAVIIVPLVWFNILPESEVLTFLIAPAPPPPAPEAPAPPPTNVRSIPKASVIDPNAFVTPTEIPKDIPAPSDEAPVIGVSNIVGGISSGISGPAGGVSGGVVGGLLAGSAPVAAPPPPKPVRREPIKVGGNVQESKLIRKIDPAYPELAKRARVQGKVVMVVNIDEEGNVIDLKVTSGHPLLNESAESAVKQWKYSPTLLNGEPVPVIATVTVIFNLK